MEKLYSNPVVESTVLTTEEMYRNAKDFVFLDLFQNKKYVKEAYLALHPEDKDVTLDDIKIVSIRNSSFPKRENDLGFTVSGKKILLLEAQTTWSDNISFRSLSYLVDSYWTILEQEQRGKDVYKAKAVFLPEPEVYIIYPFSSRIPESLSLAKVHFPGKSIPLDFQVKVLTSPEENGVLGEYIQFCRIFQKVVKKMGGTRAALELIVTECIRQNVLAEYLKYRKEVFIKTQMMFFHDDYMRMVAYAEEIAENRAKSEAIGKAKGEAIGEARGIANEHEKFALRMIRGLRSKKMSDQEIADLIGHPLSYVESIV